MNSEYPDAKQRAAVAHSAWREKHGEKMGSTIESDPDGKYADLRRDENFDPDELRAGTEEEMEHTDDPETAKQIAIDHLLKDPHWYSKAEAAGLCKLDKPVNDEPPAAAPGAEHVPHGKAKGWEKHHGGTTPPTPAPTPTPVSTLPPEPPVGGFIVYEGHKIYNEGSSFRIVGTFGETSRPTFQQAIESIVKTVKASVLLEEVVRLTVCEELSEQIAEQVVSQLQKK